MRCGLLIVLFCLSFCGLLSQNLTGDVVDTEGKPLNAVSIYVFEKNLGLLSNSAGEYQTMLDEGSYTLIFKLPDYKEQRQNISISPKDSIHLSIILEMDSLIMVDNKKNLAKEVIQHCIDKAPSYHSNLQSYKVGNYIKGEMVVTRFSNLFDRVTYRIHKFNMSRYQDQLITQELYNKVDYKYPNQYTSHLEGQLGNIPATINHKGATKLVESSIYSDKILDKISPISRRAFRFYKYDYEGFYENDSNKIHKVRVFPRFNDPELFNGWLYINDGTWNLNFAILRVEDGPMKTSTTIAYYDKENDINIPVTFYNDIAFNFLPYEGSIKYYSGLNYFQISSNENLKMHENIEPTSKPTQLKHDDTYWNKLRIQPLSDQPEVHLSDSISYQYAFKKITDHWLSRVFIGGYMIGGESSIFSARYNGVKWVFRDYNYVDGFWLGNKFDLKLKIDSVRSFEAQPYIYYVTARKRMIGGSENYFNYGLKHKGQLSLKFGSRTDDFNNLSLTRYQNYFTSLFIGENVNSFYQRDFLTLGNSIYINKRVKLAASTGIEKRSGLSNNTKFNLLNRTSKIKDNLYPDDWFDKTFYSVELTYSPNSNYSINDALEMNMRNVNPVFNIEYTEGFSSWQRNNSTYQKLKGGIIHKIKLDYFNYIDYRIEAGVFLKRGKNMHFVDYQHFGASDMLVNLNSLFDSFLLLENYQLQTKKYWATVFLNYSGKYVLLKFIPFLQGKPFTENLHLKTLYSPETDSYVEAGYSLSFNRYFGVGAFTSFHNVQGRNFGVRFSLNLRAFNTF